MANERHLALFDFDGTITDRDSMFLFVAHARGRLRLALGLLWLAPLLIGYRLKWVHGDRAKVRFLKHFFGGWSRRDLEAAAETFVDPLDATVRPEADARLQWHRDNGHDILLVSASLGLWLAPWAARRGLDVQSSVGAFDDAERFTGGLVGPNVNGEEKVVRIRGALDLDAYDTIYAYGDSSGDQPMLALAHAPNFKPFRS